MLNAVTDIVRRASGLMLRQDFRIELKDGLENIVTSSDVAVQKFLCAELRGLIPGCGFFCEEDTSGSPAAGAPVSKPSGAFSLAGEPVPPAGPEYVWIIDPIDGTANYSRGIDHCSISVALAHKGEIELGVVYSPYRDELYSAQRGCGATLNGKPIHVSGRSFADSIFCTAMSTYRKEYAAVSNDIIMETYMECNDLRRFGSAAVELCFIARGLCELYFEFRLQPWDYAAAMLILREAGGCLCDLAGTLPRLDGPDLVLAANSEASLQRLLATTRKYVKEIPYRD